MDIFKNIWVYLLGILTGSWLFIRSLFIIKLQISAFYTTYLVEEIKKKGKEFVFYKEYVEHRTPTSYQGIVYLNDCLFYFDISGREDKSDDSIGSITCFRWQIQKILPPFNFNFNLTSSKSPGIYIIEEWSASKVGNIDISEEVIPYLEQEEYINLEKDIEKVINKEKKKVGALLYGTPGNGKSYLIRYFAVKYRLPIYIFVLQRDLDNNTIIKMFNNINGPGIVIFEDFDCYFEGRKSLLEKADFTFDAIINGIDGLYSDNKGLIFFLTTNAIENVDSSLKERPSRFKYIINIKNPSKKIRYNIFQDEKLVEETEGKSLDECLRIKDFKESGYES